MNHNIYSLFAILSVGAPVSMDLSKWGAARGVVAGRLVNCYAWNDWILALLYRYTLMCLFRVFISASIHYGKGCVYSLETRVITANRLRCLLMKFL